MFHYVAYYLLLWTASIIIVNVFSDYTSVAVPLAQMPAQFVQTDGCGISKGCYRVPDSCTGGDDCEFFLSWKTDGDGVAFEFVTKASNNIPWGGFGINSRRKMDGASVVDCIVNASNNNHVTIQMSYNDGKDNVPLDNRSLGLVPGTLRGSYKDNRILCNFTRTKTVDPDLPESRKVRNLDQNYYVLTGRGPATEDGEKKKHQHNPQTSRVKISFLKYHDYVVLRSPYMIAHACLMIIAWFIFASLGIVTSRYLKPQWSNRALWGKSLWFQIHRFCLVATLCLTTVAFVLIFAAADWQFLSFQREHQPPRLHPLLGFIAVCLLLMNPIVAIFRPAPDTSGRLVFRIVHGLLGHGAHITAVIAMFFGVQECNAFLPSYARWIVLAFCAWRLLADVILSLISSANEAEDNNNFVSLSLSSDRLQVYDRMSFYRISVVTVYILGAVGVAVFLMYVICDPNTMVVE